MIKQQYKKPALAVSDQINLLKNRGLQIPDEVKAKHYLQNISYYRLSGYMYPFLTDKKLHLFKEGTSFENILDLYRFDREVRLLVFSAIEKIEIAFRSQISNQFSTFYNNPFWYTDKNYFADSTSHGSFLNTLSNTINRSTDFFIKHFQNTYSDVLPPIWAIFEILSMGQCSILYSITTKSPPRKAVAYYFGIKETVLITWLHTLVYIRNICAHHARLWNKDLRVPVKLPKRTAGKWLSSPDIANDKVYIVLAIISYFLDTITPHHTFRQKVKDLLAKYSDTNITAMGFPKDWESDPFWT
jgi:abortive infection bacteriophage resistance protein